MDLWIIAALVVGVGLLTYGGELLVRGASNLATSAGISRIVVGLTVVAFGTSAPELFISAKAALEGKSDVALGNVVGSNIFNVLFILGISALIAPLVVHAKLIRSDVLLMIGVSVLCLLLALDGTIGRVDGAILFSGLIGYTWYSIYEGKKEGSSNGASDSPEIVFPLWKNLAFIGAGLVLLVVGARSFLWGAIEVARSLGLSELVIGLTIVAAGTSLPEVATSVVAAIRGQRDIAIGNVVGSNIFNILCVLGISSILSPVGIAPAALSFDIPVMIVVAIACLPIFYTGLSINRWEGALFLLYYVAYTAFLIMDSSGHAATPVYSEIMLSYVVPLTVVTLLVVGRLEAKKKKLSSG